MAKIPARVSAIEKRFRMARSCLGSQREQKISCSLSSRFIF